MDMAARARTSGFEVIPPLTGYWPKMQKRCFLYGTNSTSPLESTEVSKKRTQKQLEMTRKMPYLERKKVKKRVFDQPFNEKMPPSRGVVPIAGGGRSNPQSFPQKRESIAQSFGNALLANWIPAFAGMTSVAFPICLRGFSGL
jgi:hypothetical protein